MNTVKISHNSQSSTITLNRPETHNAFNAQMITELARAFNEAETHHSSRVIILNADGKHFCAGADIHWMQQSIKLSTAENQRDALQLASLLAQIARCSKPTIALTQGRVMGGGCGLVACCDFAIAANNSCFCFSEVRLGLTPATIAPYIVRRIGYQATKRYFLSAEKINASTAVNLQLIDEQITQQQLLTRAQQLTQQLSANGAKAMQQTKQLLQGLYPIENSTIIDSAHQLAQLRSGEEAQEGLTAFLEKRKPRWIIT